MTLGAAGTGWSLDSSQDRQDRPGPSSATQPLPTEPAFGGSDLNPIPHCAAVGFGANAEAALGPRLPTDEVGEADSEL